MNTCIINWSAPGYTDSGEGGLFAYAMWETPGECVILSSPSIQFSDVLVHAEGPLAEDFIEADRHYQISASFPATSIVLLGSTGESLHSDDGYRQVTRDNLTSEGQTLVDTLSVVYGSDPTFVTFLDT